MVAGRLIWKPWLTPVTLIFLYITDSLNKINSIHMDKSRAKTHKVQRSAATVCNRWKVDGDIRGNTLTTFLNHSYSIFQEKTEKKRKR